MKPIKIFLHIVPENKKEIQDSVWKILKNPVEVISKIILIVIAITPIVSVSLIIPYLDHFHAGVIGFSLFSNIANLGFIIVYSFAFFALYLLVIFALPAFYGYLYAQYLPYYDINNPFKSICNNIKVNEEEEEAGQGSKTIILILSVIIFILSYKYCQKHIILNSIAMYLVINLSFILIIPPIKEDKKFKWRGMLWLLAAYIFSLLFLLFISLSHKHIFLLFIFNIMFAVIVFIFGILFANTKKTKIKQGNKYIGIYTIITIIGMFIIADIGYFHIPFYKIAINFSGLGDKKVIFKLKPNTPDYLKKQLINKSQQTKKLFLLIQTSKNYYVEKLPVKKKDIIKLPKKYVTNIINLSP
ncbi:MAG: hypothetical protein ACYCT7_01455 [bacterium]